jgi:hypothetical protein
MKGERIRKIKAYAEYFDYAPRKLEDRLTDEERKRLHAIRSDLNDVRRKAEELISDYRARIGAR